MGIYQASTYADIQTYQKERLAKYKKRCKSFIADYDCDCEYCGQPIYPGDKAIDYNEEFVYCCNGCMKSDLL